MARPVWTAQCTAGRLVRELLPVRRRESHKGDYGRVLLLCGSEGLTGAARLAAKGALRTGSGLVYLGVPEKIYPIIAAGAGSEIVFPLPCDEEGRLCMASLPAPIVMDIFVPVSPSGTGKMLRSSTNFRFFNMLFAPEMTASRSCLPVITAYTSCLKTFGRRKAGFR